MSSLERLREHPSVARIAERIASHHPAEANETGARRAAVALILRLNPLAGEPEIFFIQRADYESDPWSGQIAFPGGREEPDDVSLADTAVREIREETGIDIRGDGEILGALDDLRPVSIRLPAVVVRPYVALLGEHPEPVLSNEVAASFWVPLTSLDDRSSWRATLVTAGGIELIRTAFHHGGFAVWGMTERILSRFLELTA